jgi:hypothetical protein
VYDGTYTALALTKVLQGTRPIEHLKTRRQTMRGFQFTELQDGEELVFGPVTFTQSASFSGGQGPAQANVSKTSGRTVGITNQRVIVEDLSSADKTETYPNTDIQHVYIKRKQRGEQPTIDITRISTSTGQVAKLGIAGLPVQAGNRFKELFPNAEVSTDSSCFIATAAYGSAMAPQVLTLCQFRDTRLRANRLGQWIITTYERLSPPLATWIAERPVARAWLRSLILAPALWFVRHLAQ